MDNLKPLLEQSLIEAATNKARFETIEECMMLLLPSIEHKKQFYEILQKNFDRQIERLDKNIPQSRISQEKFSFFQFVQSRLDSFAELDQKDS